MLPQEPVKPQLPPPFAGMTSQEAREMADRDAREFADTGSKMPIVLLVIGIAGLLGAALLAFLMAYIPAVVAGVVGLAALGWGIYERISAKKLRRTLLNKYGDGQWKHWADAVGDYEDALRSYQKELKTYTDASGDVEVRLMVLRKRREALCGEREPEALLEEWQKVLAQWDARGNARREVLRTQSHLEALSAMVKPAQKPQMPDNLTHSDAETTRLLSDCAVEQQRLQNRLGQYQGRMEALGDKELLRRQLEQKDRRIARLEDTYAALTIAQETLAQARAELQRRFAPRIAKRAQELLSAMTGGRYRSLIMGEDFSLQAGTGEEDTLRDSLWRSDGTVDQLYLALRLAVAEELTPEAPLILDDALVRFDDQRLKAAVKILEETGKNKQVICFTCQGREAEASHT